MTDKHPHNRDELDLAMNRRVAELLGWKIMERSFTVNEAQYYRNLEASRGMFGVPDMPVYSPGVHIEHYWLSPDGEERSIVQDDEHYTNWALPNWSTDLNLAWRLLKMQGVSFDERWQYRPASVVAYLICERFVKAKET